MSEFAADMAATAAALLAEYGEPVTLRRETGGDFDPVTGTMSPGAAELKPTGPTTIGMPMPLTEKNKSLFGGMIQSGDRIYVLDNSVEPLLTDKLIVNGEPWNIVHIQKPTVNGQVIVYRVLVRS